MGVRVQHRVALAAVVVTAMAMMGLFVTQSEAAPLGSKSGGGVLPRVFGPSLSTSPSEVASGGDENAVAVSPSGAANAGEVAVGGDDSGVKISTDNGGLWQPTNAGLNSSTNTDGEDVHIASLYFDPSGNLWALAGSGMAGKSQLLELPEGTTQWKHENPLSGGVFSPAFTVDGTNGKRWAAGGWYGQTTPQARPTGQLMQGVTGTYGLNIYAATDSGMLECVTPRVGSCSWGLRTGSSDWSTAGDIATGFAVDPNHADDGFVAAKLQLGGTSNSYTGLWLVTGLSSVSATTYSSCQVPTPISGGGAFHPEEVVSVNVSGTTYLYVAAGDQGLWSLAAPTSCPVSNPGWVQVDTQSPLSTTANNCGWWSTVSAYYDSTSGYDIVWPACLVTGTGSSLNAVWKLRITPSTGVICSGSSCAKSIGYSSESVSCVIGAAGQACGASGYTTWWHIDNRARLPDSSNANVALGSANDRPSQIVVDPTDTARVYVASQGVWETTDNGADWYPAVSGLATTLDHQVLYDPYSSDNGNSGYGNIVDADTDWSTLLSAPGSGDHLVGSEPWNDQQTVVPTTNRAYELAFDQADSNPYLFAAGGTPGTTGSSNNGNNGWIAVNASPFATGGGTWSGINAPCNLDDPVIGFAAGENSAGSNMVFLAISAENATYGCQTGSTPASCPSTCVGLYRAYCSLNTTCSTVTWSAVTMTGNAMTNYVGNGITRDHDDIYWPTTGTCPGAGCTYGKYIYLLDPPTGLWMSSDYGMHWAMVDNSLRDNVSYSDELTGNGNTLYVTQSTGVYQLTGCSTSTDSCNTPTQLTCSSCTLTVPGTVAVSGSGYIWVTQAAEAGSYPTGASDVGLYESTSPGGTALSVATTDSGFVGQALDPNGLTVDCSAGYAYLPANGMGIAVVSGISTC